MGFKILNSMERSAPPSSIQADTERDTINQPIGFSAVCESDQQPGNISQCDPNPYSYLMWEQWG
jgi:hypothetical protein